MLDATSLGAWPASSMALASSVTAKWWASNAPNRSPKRNIWGVWASHLPPRSKVCSIWSTPSEFTKWRSNFACLSVSGKGKANMPPTGSVTQACIKRSINSGVIRQRAASCTSTQSCVEAPSDAKACRPLCTVWARVAPPQAARSQLGGLSWLKH